MTPWAPSRIWEGEDAYIIGGGPSLSSFDWELLHGRNTVGCNSAFSLGVHVCNITLFGDVDWWEGIGREGTESYGGLVVGLDPKLRFAEPCSWLLSMERNTAHSGLHRTKLVWAGNTGAAAVNLALILGAKRVFLLGFDMKMEKNKPNWHTLRYQKGEPSVYPRFIRSFLQLPKTLQSVFPGCEIINVTDDSALDYFPKVSVAEHFQEVAA